MSQYMRTPEAAEYVGLSQRTLEKMRVEGIGPPYSKPGNLRAVVYRKDDLDAWVEAGVRGPWSNKTEKVMREVHGQMMEVTLCPPRSSKAS